MNDNLGKITKLSYTKKGDRVNVYVDDYYKFSVEANLILEFDLYLGKEVDEKFQKEIIERDFERLLTRKAIEKLGRRPNTKEEIMRFLNTQTNKFKEKEDSNYSKIEIDSKLVIDRIVEYLISTDKINDLEFSKWFVDIKSSKKSANEIKRLLFQKGVPNEVINKALSSKEVNNEELIKKVISKKFKSLEGKKISNIEKRKKVIQSLIRRGFDYSEIIKHLNTEND